MVDISLEIELFKCVIFVVTSFKQQTFAIKSLPFYCPPRLTISDSQYYKYYKSLGPCFLATGVYNAKHIFWGSRLVTPKGRVLFDTNLI